jgi:Bardet-Biedl syndrome 2 protein
VDRNADSFFVDVQDGVNSLVAGKLNGFSKPLLIAGGNCSILGFDVKGTESLWNVTGDNVSAMTLCDLDTNNQPALLVGSDDFEIRIFRGEDLTGEITEADRVTFLHALRGGPKFAYGLANGTVGVYSANKTRMWRVKTKNQPTALYSYDLDSDGVPEVFSGWSTGQFTVRREENGEVLFKEAMDAPVAGIVSADYRMDGKEEVMICSEAGEVRAYLSTDVEFGALLDSGVGKNNVADQKALGELQAQKLELIAELNLLEKTLRSSNSKNDSGGLQVGTLPTNTALTYTLEADFDLHAVVLRVEVNTDVQIVNLIAVDLGEPQLVLLSILILPKHQRASR